MSEPLATWGPQETAGSVGLRGDSPVPRQVGGNVRHGAGTVGTCDRLQDAPGCPRREGWKLRYGVTREAFRGAFLGFHLVFLSCAWLE